MPIETERLLLRPIEPSDLDDFVALHADREVTRFIRPLDRAAAEVATTPLLNAGWFCSRPSSSPRSRNSR